MATFKILETFNLTSRGFVIVGDITTDETISVGDLISVPVSDDTVELKIIGVEMVDKMTEKIAHIGLMISTEDQEKIKNIALKGMEISTRAL